MREFRELYRRERQWLIILPEVARNLPPPDVDHAVAQHLEQTAAQVIRLEEIFQLMAMANRRDSRAMRPLLKEADDVLAAVTRSSAATRRRVFMGGSGSSPAFYSAVSDN